MIKICYIDLSAENYSRYPNSYGGAGMFARHAKDHFPEFHIYSDGKSFADINPRLENSHKCFELSANEQQKLKNGEPVKDIIPEINYYDILLHHHAGIHFNLDETRTKQACWVIGTFEKVHPQNTHFACFNAKWQRPILSHSNHKVSNVLLGVPMPEFQEYQKEDFLFQCTNQSPAFQSIQVADICNRNGIPIYFGGPISENYPLLDYIDNKNSRYLGVMKQADKIDYTKRALGHTLMYGFDVNNISLSAMESLSYGTPILCAPAGYMGEWLKPGKNGWFAINEGTFVEKYHKLKELSQKDCYNSIKDYNIFNMLDSFEKFIEKVVSE